jgi:hypothetical protein
VGRDRPLRTDVESAAAGSTLGTGYIPPALLGGVEVKHVRPVERVLEHATARQRAQHHAHTRAVLQRDASGVSEIVDRPIFMVVSALPVVTCSTLNAH